MNFIFCCKKGIFKGWRGGWKEVLDICKKKYKFDKRLFTSKHLEVELTVMSLLGYFSAEKTYNFPPTVNFANNFPQKVRKSKMQQLARKKKA